LQSDGLLQFHQMPAADQTRAIRRLGLWMGLEWSQERAEKYLVVKCKKHISEANRQKLKKAGLVGPRTTARLQREAAALQAAAALDEECFCSL
jgi:hypothetical protein